MKRWRALILALAIAGCSDGAAPGGGDGGGPGPDGGAPVGDGGGPSCSGRALTQSGVLDLPITSVRVSGGVTLGGQPLPLPAGSSTRGALIFTETTTLAAFGVELGANGPAAYDAWLAPGVYDVSYRGDPAWCAQGPSPLPCNGGILKRAVPLLASGALDLDVPPPVQVTGAVTLNGAALPSGTRDRGYVSFSGATSASLGTSGVGHYQLTLFPGDYEVRYDSSASACDAAPMPCVGGVLKSNIALSASGVLDLDIPAIQITGAVTLNGAALPSVAGGRGGLGFSTNHNYSAFADLGTTGPGQYRATLIPGIYDIAYSPSGGCSGPFPCNAGTVKAQLALNASGALDLDIPAVQITGTVTLNGAALPSTGGDRGQIAFDWGATVSLGTTGAAQYRIMLFPGIYDIEYQSRSCSPMPCNNGPLKTKFAINTSGVLDIDIPAISVSGAVTLNSAALPASTADRGGLWFQLDGGGASSAEQTLGLSGPGHYQVTLLPGSYSIAYSPSQSTCDGAVLPCYGGFVKSKIALDSSGALDIDIPAIQISGAVTLNGGALPSTAGTLSFSGATLPLAPTYRLTLIPGAYVIRYQSPVDLCQGVPGPGLPCGGETIIGCP